jgi:hypothetical protein
MEPTTNPDAGRFGAHERGEPSYLAPSEDRAYDLERGVLGGQPAIDEFAARVDAAGGAGGHPAPKER